MCLKSKHSENTHIHFYMYSCVGMCALDQFNKEIVVKKKKCVEYSDLANTSSFIGLLFLSIPFGHNLVYMYLLRE